MPTFILFWLRKDIRGFNACGFQSIFNFLAAPLVH